MVKKTDVDALFSTFEKEIARLEAKKHKSEADLQHLNRSIRALEKHRIAINKLLSTLMAKDSALGDKQVRMKGRLDRQTSKLEKLKMLYKDLKDI